MIVWHVAQIALYTYGRNETDSMNFTLWRFTVCSLIRDFVPSFSEARLRSSFPKIRRPENEGFGAKYAGGGRREGGKRISRKGFYF